MPVIVYRGEITRGDESENTTIVSKNERSFVKNSPLTKKEIDGNFKGIETELVSIYNAFKEHYDRLVYPTHE